MGGVSIWHWLVVGVIMMLLFGRGKVSELMGDMAKGIKAFKKGMADDDAPAASSPLPAEPVRNLEHRGDPIGRGDPVSRVDPLGTSNPTLADRKLG